MRLTVTILTCRDMAVTLRMAVDAAEGSVFFLAVHQRGVHTLVTTGADVVFNLSTVLDIGR